MKKNILIYPAGSEAAINIFNSLKYNLHFDLFGASMVNNHASFIYKDNHYYEGDLNINNEKFIENFNSVLKKFNIDFIIPTHDTVALFLMENEKKIISTIVCSPLETTKIAHNKLSTYEALKNNYYMPKLFTKDKIENFPVFLKPCIGAGGKGTALVNNLEELNAELKKNPDLIIFEYLPGEEYTVDCFTNKDGILLFAYARTRERIKTGITNRSTLVFDNKEFEEIAESINKQLKFRGAWFFQVKKDINGKLKLMEISIRQSGTMVFFRQLGINFSSLSLFDFMGLDNKIICNKFNLILDRCLHDSFKIDYDYDNVYIDFDDTIIVNDKVNSSMMKLIYQLYNKKKNIFLITKHSKDIYDSLKNHSIPTTLFKEIILLSNEEEKYRYINPKNSIFIDNYFRERNQVFTELNIPVFDVDAIQCLLDDSEY